MNWRRMFFTGLINTAVGIGIGIILFELAAPPFTSRPYQALGRYYVLAGGVGGFLTGWSWEGLRQLKVKRDREEAEFFRSFGPKK
ncbi:MAG: hypothetical protein ACFBSG_07910 [Leptolyngbyaceae cyanobacterium]